MQVFLLNIYSRSLFLSKYCLYSSSHHEMSVKFGLDIEETTVRRIPSSLSSNFFTFITLGQGVHENRQSYMGPGKRNISGETPE